MDACFFLKNVNQATTTTRRFANALVFYAGVRLKITTFPARVAKNLSKEDYTGNEKTLISG